jgi:DNA-binding MarR family transcriptional regulator
MGLVEKMIDKSDRRSRLLHSTPAGIKKVKTFYPQYDQFVASLFDQLTQHEKRNMILCLKRIRNTMPLAQENL